MKNPENITDCLIIGSGICGLMAANKLVEAGLLVLTLDKGRGTGGRLATRWVGEEEDNMGMVDYGAPLLTVETPVMQSLANDWQRDGVIKLWLGDSTKTTGKHYIGQQGMRGIARYLARDIYIRQSEKVVRIQQQNRWKVMTEAGNHYQSRILILTAPLPQALMLLDENQISLEPVIRTQLGQIEYDPCLALFGLLNAPSKLQPPGALFMEKRPIRWISDHQERKISGIPTFTTHLSAKISHQYWNLPEEQIIAPILPKITDLLGAKPKTTHIHRWRYANARNTFSQPFYLQEEPLPLILAGDSFGAGGLEGAILSGIAVAEVILEKYV